MAGSNFASLESAMLSDTSFTDFLSEFLRFAGTGISSVSGGTVELDLALHFPGMPEIEREKLLQKISEAVSPSVLMIEDRVGKQYLLVKSSDGLIKLVQLVTQRHHENGDLIGFTIDEELEGTQRLINLIPALFMLKKKKQKKLFLLMN